jgi:hypothetical protein
MSRAEFAAVTGFGEATVARWESGALLQNVANDRYLRALVDAHVFERIRTLAAQYAGTGKETPSERRFKRIREDIPRLRRQGLGFFHQAGRHRRVVR